MFWRKNDFCNWLTGQGSGRKIGGSRRTCLPYGPLLLGDAKTLSRQARAPGPEVVKQIQERMVALAVKNKVIQGRRMRVDTTVVETNIHYPTDSSLPDDGHGC